MSILNNIISAKGIRIISRKVAYPIIRHKVRKDLSSIVMDQRAKHYDKADGSIMYIRNDLWLKKKSNNGAVAHTEGVTNALVKAGKSVDVFSPYEMDFVNGVKSKTVLEPRGILSGISELSEMEYSSEMAERIYKTTKTIPSMIYQRYGRNNYTGILLGKRWNIPVVMEYNGSEIWMSHNWGTRLRYESLCKEIEDITLTNADLIVCNAQALYDELVAKGVEEKRILCIPNGVDPDRFSSEISGYLIRKKHNLCENDKIISFVGSFGPWHGAEVLAKSIKSVLAEHDNAYFFMIGKGAKLEEVKNIIAENQVTSNVIFTGEIDRNEIPAYLAASDILVSPQVPNPDGTPFFGSPTKLFEYMSMGRAIVASNLDQIGEILTDGKDSLLFTPGDHVSLSEAIVKLLDSAELRAEIGHAARKVAVEKFSWGAHVNTIFSKIDSLYADFDHHN